jgi:ornithine cyclodeaminase/alanine dehydrogenase-like protein (mu-crystallin family)
MALFLNESEVSELLPVAECIDVLERAFRYAADGLAENVPRSRMRLPSGFLHFMAAACIGPDLSGFGYKAYSTFPGGGKFLVMLYDSDSGGLLAVMEAVALGQIRTGTASGLATRHMARAGAADVGIIGTGHQAQTQLEAVCAVRPITNARVFSRRQERREDFAKRSSERLQVDVQPVDNAQECVEGADIVITITSAREPVALGEWLGDGAHVNAAGGNHWLRREIDEAAVLRSELIVVDDLEQAKMECGDLMWLEARGTFRWDMAHELRDVVAGRVPGRLSADGVTLFESLGVALEDIAAAELVYRKAREQGIGQELPF